MYFLFFSIRDNIMGVEVFMKSTSYTEITHVPAYDTANLFGETERENNALSHEHLKANY